MNVEELQSRTRELFRMEAAELLQDLETALLDLEKDAGNGEAIDRVFRVMHTIKGSGATSGFKALSGFVHRVEDVYNSAREGRIAITPEIIGTTLKIKDVIAASLSPSLEDEAELFKNAGGLLTALSSEPKKEAALATSASAPIQERVRWHLTVKPKEPLLKSGVTLECFWDDLRALGTCEFHAAIEALPPWNKFDPEVCYATWEIILEAATTEEALREIFLFAGDDAEIEIHKEPQTRAPLPSREEPAKLAAPSSTETLRVASAKIDQLVNLAGELMILRFQVQNACGQLNEVPPALAAAEEGLRRLADHMRQVVLEVRMMPVAESFSKFRRVVRDLALQFGKEVEWTVEGGDTEMDKTLLDQLADPLMHMVRNSLDHGLEAPEEREASGKPRTGHITLKAEQRGDRVFIRVLDDGRGLDAKRIRKKAIERGLLGETETPSTSELYQLIFLPGFSTSDSVSEVSGRGVGMDVVRKRIESLRGTVELHSEPGKGTEIRMSLPLTLAIVDGLLVSVAGERYLLPLSLARETVALPKSEAQQQGRGQIIEVRGECVPYLRLSDLFETGKRADANEKAIIVTTESGNVGLVVDEVLGTHQIVLKSLGWVGQKVKYFSGCTVLGDGQVALVIDVPGLVERVRMSGALSRKGS